MSGKMSVHLFQVVTSDNTTPLESLFKQINSEPLEKRLHTISSHQIRLEHIAEPYSEKNDSPYWLLDFIKLRFENGPGKAGKNSAIEGFNLNKDQGFGEETSALYDPKTNYIIIQYNHHGVRASAIQKYLNLYDHSSDEITGYEFLIKLDESSEMRLAEKNIITKIHFKVASTQMTDSHRVHNVSLGNALDINANYNGSNIELTIAADRGQKLITSRAKDLISALKSMVSVDEFENTSAVKTFTVSGKNSTDDRVDAINMLSPKLELEIDQLVLGEDRRYTLISRWNGLIRARRGWRKIISS